LLPPLEPLSDVSHFCHIWGKVDLQMSLFA